MVDQFRDLLSLSGDLGSGAALSLGREPRHRNDHEGIVLRRQAQQPGVEATATIKGLSDDLAVPLLGRPDDSVAEIDCGHCRPWLRALDAIYADGWLGTAVEDHRRTERNQVTHQRVAITERSGRVRNIARLVRIHG